MNKSVRAMADYTFISRYARYDNEKNRRTTWDETVTLVENMHYMKYDDVPAIIPDIQWSFDQVRKKRVLGSQRALQYGGQPILKKNARMYNCLHKDTEFITSKGVKKFSDFNNGDEITVLTHTGKWKDAVVKYHGKDKLYDIAISRGTLNHNIKATINHRWILKDGNITDSLKCNDQLMFPPNIFTEFEYDDAPVDERLYWTYGFVFGDGTRIKNSKKEYTSSRVRLCGKDIKYLYRFEELGFNSSSSLSLKGDAHIWTGQYLKTLPDLDVDDPRLIKAFVRGYLDADGNKKRSGSKLSLFSNIICTGEEIADFIKKAFPVAGVYVCKDVDKSFEKTNFGTRKPNTHGLKLTNEFGQTAKSFKVISISDEFVIDDVWCLEVEDDHSFIMPFGLVTGNCTASYADRIRFFQEAFWLLLCGCGVGMSVQKHHVAKIPKIAKPSEDATVYIIPDSIEGWADSLGVLLSSYFVENQTFPEFFGKTVTFDYSLIRAKGSQLSSGVGQAPGSEGLRHAHTEIRKLLDRELLKAKKGALKLRSIDVYDIVMHASDAVLSGGVRRSACITLFSLDDEDMMTAKTGNWRTTNPQRGRSNNSVLLIRDQVSYKQFEKIIENAKQYGEPGFVWADHTELLVNPCAEIGLFAYETFLDDNGKVKRDESSFPIIGASGWCFCNLTEINGGKIKSREDFEIAVKAASIIGTLQAGYTTFDYLGEVTENIVKREALMGVSITGMMDNPDIIFDETIQCEMAQLVLDENERVAKMIGINPAARTTCVKPAGTTSLILSTASGIHPHHAKRYFRRIQSNKAEIPLQWLKLHNPKAVESSTWSATNTDEIITFCIEVGRKSKTKNDLDAITLLEHVKNTQKNWVTSGTRHEQCVAPWLRHNVSNTIHVKDDEWEAITSFIYENRKFFAGISLVSINGDKDYPQAPNCAVYTTEEILKEYGDGSLLASGLIVDGLHAFGDLWEACDAALQQSKPIYVPELKVAMEENPEDYNKIGLTNITVDALLEAWLLVNVQNIVLKRDWVRRAKQFAIRYFDEDVRRMTYCLKDVNNVKLWKDLQREYTDVDYTKMFEDKDNTKIHETIACANGVCEIHV